MNTRATQMIRLAKFMGFGTAVYRDDTNTIRIHYGNDVTLEFGMDWTMREFYAELRADVRYGKHAMKVENLWRAFAK